MIEIRKLDDELIGQSIKIVFHQNNKRHSLEIFMDYNKDEGDVEAILSIEDEVGHGGTLDYVVSKLNKYIKI